MYRRAVHSFRVRRPLPDNTLQRTVDSSTCHLTILLILTSQSLLLRKTIVQERVRGALKPAALTPLIPVSSSRRTQTDSVQESRRPRDQLCTVEVCRHPPRVLPVSILRPPCHGPSGPQAAPGTGSPCRSTTRWAQQTVYRSLAALVISFYCRGLPASPPRAARLRPPHYTQGEDLPQTVLSSLSALPRTAATRHSCGPRPKA